MTREPQEESETIKFEANVDTPIYRKESDFDESLKGAKIETVNQTFENPRKNETFNLSPEFKLHTPRFE